MIIRYQFPPRSTLPQCGNGSQRWSDSLQALWGCDAPWWLSLMLPAVPGRQGFKRDGSSPAVGHFPKVRGFHPALTQPPVPGPCCPAPAGRESLLHCPSPESPADSPDVPASFGLAKSLGCLAFPLWMPGVTILVTSQFSCWILAHQDTGVQARLQRTFLGAGLEYWEVLCLGRFVSL